MRFKIVLIIFISLYIIIQSGCASKEKTFSPCVSLNSGEELTFFIVTDPHYISKNTHDYDKAFSELCCACDGKLLSYTDEIIDTLIWEIEENKPDFLIICGDLTCNGEKESHLELAKKLEHIEKKGTCTFVIPGNHDIDNPWARVYFGQDALKTESVSILEFSDIYKMFGFKEAILRDENSLSYLVTPSEDIWLLMLDSTKRNNTKSSKTPEISGEISAKTLKWIEKCAALAKEHNAKLIVSMHHSLLEHNSIINQNYVIDNSKEVLGFFQKLDINLILTGHIHLQDIKSINVNNYSLVDIATGSIVAFPNKYGILKYNPKYGYEYYSKKIDVEGWAINNNITDENLINFNIYSKEFFEEKSYSKYYECIISSKDILEEDYEFIAQSIAKLNTGYFDGFRNEMLESIIDINRFKIIIEKLPITLKNYLKSMLDDQYTNNNKFFISTTEK